MIKPALELMQRPDIQCFYFLADLHALNTVADAKTLVDNSYDAAATWIALGLDPAKVVFYRESDIPEIPLLNCLLAPIAQKSLMNQAHAYKAIVAQNRELGKVDLDDGVSVGLFNYPVLMGADILAFDVDLVPVGKDQTQHVEIARDLARRFNLRYGEILKSPQGHIQEATATIPGTDGRKMSKSYDNVIPIFQPAKAMQKCISRITTDSSPPSEPKDPSASTLFALFQGFAAPEQVDDMRQRYLRGVGWGDVKKELFGVIQERLAEPYKIYLELIADRPQLDRILAAGAERARAVASDVVAKARTAAGLTLTW
jgi:tryptophanyl-tRNA synthetase